MGVHYRLNYQQVTYMDPVHKRGERAKIQQKSKKIPGPLSTGESPGVSPDDSPSGELAAPIRAADLCNPDGKTVYSCNKDLT
jgi:hypothetical protein